MAGNILALKMIEDICHIKLSWGGWALAGVLPGIIMLLLTPLIIYKLYPPELKKVDNKAIAKAGIESLGPMTLREKCSPACLSWRWAVGYSVNRWA